MNFGDNIRVNAVCTGFIDTPMLQSFFGDAGDIESLREAVRDIHPLRRYGTPDDVASLVTGWPAMSRNTRADSRGCSTAVSPPKCSR